MLCYGRSFLTRVVASARLHLLPRVDLRFVAPINVDVTAQSCDFAQPAQCVIHVAVLQVDTGPQTVVRIQ